MKLIYLLAGLIALAPTALYATTLEEVEQIAQKTGADKEVVLATYYASGNTLNYEDLLSETQTLLKSKGKDSLEKYIQFDKANMDKRVNYLSQAMNVFNSQSKNPLNTRWIVDRERLNGAPLRVTSQYSYRDNGEMHRALDFGVKEFVGENGKQGELNLYPVHDGRVMRIEHNANSSTGLAVWYEFQEAGSTYSVVYMHMNDIFVNVGDKITKNTPLGVVGDTGNANGLHIHMQVEKDGVRINPLRLWGYDPTASFEERLDWFYDNNLGIVCGAECTESLNHFTDDKEFSVVPCRKHRKELYGINR